MNPSACGISLIKGDFLLMFFKTSKDVPPFSKGETAEPRGILLKN
jgi:hypothetical protein